MLMGRQNIYTGGTPLIHHISSILSSYSLSSDTTMPSTIHFNYSIMSFLFSLLLLLGISIPMTTSFLSIPNRCCSRSILRPNSIMTCVQATTTTTTTTMPQSEDEIMEQLKELARTTSKDPMAIVQAAQLQKQVLQQQASSSSSSSSSLVNLFLEIYAYSKDSSAIQLGQELFNTLNKPDETSIALVMEGYIRQGQIDPVMTLYETYQTTKTTTTTTDENSSSSLLLFHKVLKAYGRVGQPDKAYELLQERIQQGKRVDQKAWIHVLRAYRSKDDSTTTTIEKLIGEMMRGFRKEGLEEWFPTIDAYNVLLSANRNDAEEAEKLLYELISQSKEGNNESVKPNMESFYHLMQAYAKQKQPSAFKVETILQLQKALGMEHTSSAVLQTAIFVISKSRDHNKAQKAVKLLQQLGDEANTNSFSNVLAACAYTSPAAKPEDKLAAFEIALDMFQKLTQDDTININSRTFVLMLRCCEVLMKNPIKRDAMVRSVFHQGCEAGVMNESVIKAFSRAGSEALQLQLLNGFMEDGFEIPSEWSRNLPSR